MSRSRPLVGRAGTLGEALPVAVLFPGALFTVLVGVRVMVVAVARTAAQAAAGAAANAAQSAAPGDRWPKTCRPPGSPWPPPTARPPRPAPRPWWRSPSGAGCRSWRSSAPSRRVFGGVEFIVWACGPLDDITTSALASAGHGDAEIAAAACPWLARARRPRRPPRWSRGEHSSGTAVEVAMFPMLGDRAHPDAVRHHPVRAGAAGRHKPMARTAAPCC